MPQFLPDDQITVKIDQIQGNILAGFNKDYEALLFIEFQDPAGARTWLNETRGNIATMQEVLDFNRLFKLIGSRRSSADDTDTIQATWVNIALTHRGLLALGRTEEELGSFEEA